MIKYLTSQYSRSNWNLEMLVFEEKGKPEYPEKNLGARTRTNTAWCIDLLTEESRSRSKVWQA